MKKSLKLGILILTVGILLACTLSTTPTPVPLATDVSPPVAASVSAPPFEGIWISEGDLPEIIAFTTDSMYRVQSDMSSGTESYSREQFANIVSYDLENNHISLRTQWFRVNGKMSGFDSPNFTITYLIEDDTLKIGIGWDGEFATEVDLLVYHRK